MLRQIRAWVREFRVLFLLFGVVPVVVGSIVAYDYYPDLFSWYYFVLTIVAILLLHAGTIVFNDYFDFRSGADVLNEERTPFTGGTGLLVDRVLKPRDVLLAGCVSFALCIALGMYIVFTRSPIIFLFGLVGVAIGAFYTAPPIRLAYRLLGETAWFLSFPLTALGALFTLAPPASFGNLVAMQGAVFDTIAVMLPVAFLGTAGFFVLEFPDYHADQAARKIGMAVALGKKTMISAYVTACLLAYLSLLALVVLGFLPVFGLSIFVTVPLCAWVWYGLRKYYETPVRLVPYIVVGAGAIYLASVLIMVALCLR